MTHDEAVALLGAYALDAVPPEEAVLVAAHVAECPRCTAELDAHREVAGMLGDLGGEAPPVLWAAIASQATVPEGASEAAEALGGLAAQQTVPAGPATRRRATTWQRAAAAVVAVAAAVAIVLLGVQVSRLNDRVSTLTALARAHGLGEAVQAALLDPSAQRITLRADGGHGKVVAELVVVPAAHSFLVDSRLPPLPRTRTYQLWAVTVGPPISLGLLGSNPDVVPFIVNHHRTSITYAISVEPASGSSGPTSTPIAAGT